LEAEEGSTRGVIEQAEQYQESSIERLNSEQEQISMSQRLDSIKNLREEGYFFFVLSSNWVLHNSSAPSFFGWRSVFFFFEAKFIIFSGGGRKYGVNLYILKIIVNNNN
jgi:hypothetical protein